jgi:hypothetical protein
MSRNEKRRQKKLQVRKKKRSEKKQTITRIHSSGVSARMKVAGSWKIIDARITAGLWDEGIGYASLARRGPSGIVAGVVPLVDVYCLGLKDTVLFFDCESDWFELMSKLERSGQSWATVLPEHVRKVVDGAVAYARAHGIEPHRDFAGVTTLFGDIDASQCLTEFTYGMDGRPYFIPGPHDSPVRVSQVMEALSNSAGPDNFNFTTPVSAGDLDDESDESARPIFAGGIGHIL